MTTITKVVVPASVGPLELAHGIAYTHDAELDGDEELCLDMRVEALDESGRYFAARVVAREGSRWRLELTT